jgi:hypothetical protein
MPANTLPPITRISASDAKRITMPLPIYGTIANFVKESSMETESTARKYLMTGIIAASFTTQCFDPAANRATRHEDLMIIYLDDALSRSKLPICRT